MSKRKDVPEEQSYELPLEHVLAWATRDKVFKKAMRIASAKLSKDGKYVDFGTKERANVVERFCVNYDAMKTKHEERVSDLFLEIDKEKYEALDHFQVALDARPRVASDAASTYALLDRLKHARTEKKQPVPSFLQEEWLNRELRARSRRIKPEVRHQEEEEDQQKPGPSFEENLKRAGLL